MPCHVRRFFNIKIISSTLNFGLSISGMEDPVTVTLKKVKAKKITPKVSAAKVTVAKDAAIINATANIVCTYKDSRGILHMISPEKTELKLNNAVAFGK